MNDAAPKADPHPGVAAPAAGDRGRRPRLLAVLLNGRLLGELEQLATGRLVLRYDEAWRSGGPGIPLSLCLPLAASEHAGRALEAYLWGLLPDNADVLAALARDADPGPVSPRSVFGLLGVTGADCPGAVQFLPPARAAEPEDGGVEWLDEAGVADAIARARMLLPPRAPGRGGGADRRGRFSLPGAQPKTALHRDPNNPDRWGFPLGRTPTTHILKPPMPGLAGQLANEHFCLRLAALAGLRAAETRVLRFGAETAIAVRRFDRTPAPNRPSGWLRLHQEDMCQALGVHPADKYQRDGGPGVADVVEKVLRSSAAPREAVEGDAMAFLLAVAFNWLVGGSDAHAKNYSVLHFRAGAHRLAPLYDVNSVLPYVGDAERDWRLSMKVAGRDDPLLLPRHWERLAGRVRTDAGALLAGVRAMLAALPDLASDLCARCAEEGLEDPVLPALANAIAKRCVGLSRVW